MGKMTEADYRTAMTYYDSAIGLDPTFALAYSDLSGAYGAMYATLPRTMPSRVVLMDVAALAMPKSMTRATPSAPTITFCGEMSR